MNILTNHFITNLFDKEDHTVITDTVKGRFIAKSVDELKFETNQFFSINAIEPGLTRSKHHVTKFRTFLLEMDTTDLDQQIPIIKNSGLPYTACVFSGNKSYHFYVSLDQPLESLNEYNAYWKAINAALLISDIHVDSATKDPARLARAPFATRNNGNEQTCVEVNKRVKRQVLDNWLKMHNINWQDYLVVESQLKSFEMTNPNADAERAFDWIKRKMMKNDQYVEGNRHDYQVKMAYYMLRAGIDAAEIEQQFIREFGEVSTGIGRVETLKESASGDPVYVPSVEQEARGWSPAVYRPIEQQMREIMSQEQNRPPEPPQQVVNLDDYAESINRYYRIGTQYYKWMPDTQSFLKWNKDTFKDDYGRRAEILIENRFNDFKFEPDFVKPELILGIGENRYMNSFRKPELYHKAEQIKKSHLKDFPDILKVLKYAYDDQIKQALTWCAVAIQHPKQPLPAQVFLGREGDGKTSVAQLLGLLFGNYFKNCSTKQFESDFNQYLDECLLLLINEAGNWKDGNEVMNTIKELVTDKELTVNINGKYEQQKNVHFWGKLFFTSNQTNPFNNIGDGTRFWVRRCIGERPRIKNFWETIKNQMPYFINYLMQMELDQDRLNKSDGQYRLYFTPEEYDTSYKEEMKGKEIETEMYSEILDLINDFFIRHPDQEKCFVDLKSIKQNLENSNRKGINNEIKDCMYHSFKKDRSKLLDRPDSLSMITGINDALIRKSQWWIFTKDDVNLHDDLTRQMNEIMNN